MGEAGSWFLRWRPLWALDRALTRSPFGKLIRTYAQKPGFYPMSIDRR
ncbi:MAG: hypothetical protein M3N42_06715 [Cyanobacteriota bacterium]|nr:hypothetical protein [Cyanobacteriota bacterium]